MKMERLILVLVILLINDGFCQPIAISTIQGNCGPDSYTVLGNGTTCWNCFSCPPGFEASLQCGSFVKRSQVIECKLCSAETYSDTYSRSSCKRCKTCEEGLIEVRKCTPASNTVCQARKSHCKRGFYLSELFDCLPCSPCCGDSKDIAIDECATQGAQSRKLCSVHSYHRCFKNVDENATQSVEIEKRRFRLDFVFITGSKNIRPTSSILVSNKRIYKENEDVSRIYKSEYLALLISLIVSLNILIVMTLYIKIKSKRKSSEALCFPMRLSQRNKNLSVSKNCKSDQSDDLVDWSNNDVSSFTYVFRCGVGIKYNPESKQDRFKNLAVEALTEQTMESHFRSIKPEQIFLSPTYKFYTQGETFEKKVKITLPHSALYTSNQKTWDIEILCMDERKEKDAKWDKITDGLEVNWKDVSFYTNTLLTYAVVGKPLQEAKKRMQLVLFATSEMISDLFEVRIHLLDDNETSFQNVLRENSLKGLAMLGSFYAAFVDCYNSVDINVNVEGLLDGWELDHLKPEFISSSDCKESYFSIPYFQGAFRRVKRRADKFSCKFRIDFAGNEIIIPAFTFVPEEEFCVVVDVHDQDHDTSVLKEKKTLFKDLHYDTKYVMGRMLDVSLQGQGTWRQLGRHFGLGEDELVRFSVEYRTLEGSPSLALFEYLLAAQPKMTVGEFVKCLESLGREDVIALLYKHLKKKPLNANWI